MPASTPANESTDLALAPAATGWHVMVQPLPAATPGDDVLPSGPGDDVLRGGAGLDTVSYELAESGVTVSLAIRGPQATGGAGTDTLIGCENLTGSAFADTLTGAAGANVIDGRAGDDTLDGGAGADHLIGGAGNDTFIVDNRDDIVSETAGEGTDTVIASVRYTLPDAVENLTLTGTANLSGTGNALANTVTGNAGNNLLDGRGGADALDGGAGNDLLVGAGGPAPGDDDVIDGGSGRDLATYAAAGAAVFVNLTLSSPQDTGGGGIDTLRGIEDLAGSAFADFLVGTADTNTLSGGRGNDVLQGGAGADRLEGGAGSDFASYVDASGAVAVDLAIAGPQDTGGDGADTLVGIENLIGSRFNDSLFGRDGRNLLVGGDGNDLLDGRAGADSMQGGAGDDTYVVDNPGDQVSEVAALPNGTLADAGGADSVFSTVSFALTGTARFVENLTLTGNAATSATGSAQANTLTGNDAANRLTGGRGVDHLTGGGGADVFVFAARDTGGSAATADVINDFAPGQDVIQLSAIDADVTSPGTNQAFAFIGTEAFGHHAGELRVATLAGDTLVEGDTNGDGVADLVIVLAGTVALTAGDFVL